ncbi:hypothetical protein N9H39_07240 [Gammaproteobacteria bacterium]|nr:hypothetical protein [Gammaproteobacteria bacterium]
MDVQVVPIATNIIIVVLAMVLWALAFVRLAFGFRIIADTKSGIRVPWIQIGWVVFAWAFLIASFWPVIDVLLKEEWFFSDLLLMVLGGLIFFFAAAVIAPDGTYKDADGEARYLEVAPLFFGLFATYQVWLIVMDNVLFGSEGAVRIGLSVGAVVLSLLLAFSKNMSVQKFVSVVAWVLAMLIVFLQANEVIVGRLVRTEELAPHQGWIVALWVGCIALAVLMAVALTMVQIINRHTGFRPYITHTAWAVWFFFWMLLIWWRTPTLATSGWEYIHLLVVTAGPLLLFLSWTFLAPQGTEGSAEAAQAQYFEKAPQAFRLLALLAVWAILINLWLIGGATAITASIGWGVGLALFIALTRSSNTRLHGGVVAFAWVLLIAEYIFELVRGVPTL